MLKHNDMQEWETYKGFRIIPSLIQFDNSNPETEGQWVVSSVEIHPLETGIAPKTLRPKGLTADSKREAFLKAIDFGRNEIDNTSHA